MMPLFAYPVSNKELNTFFKKFDFSQDSKHVKQCISFIQEATSCYQNIIHELYNLVEEEVVGFVILSSTKEVDDIVGILIEFIYIKPKYRNKLTDMTHTKYSHFLLDYVVETAIKIQKEIAINHIYLVPINEKVRKVYAQYGFEHIPNSIANEFEDYMVFNLLEEDFTIL